MEIGFGINFIEIGIFFLLVVVITFLMMILSELQQLNKKKEETEVVDARVTRRDINDDYGFRNPLLRSETGYRVNRRGQYVPNKPNVEEDEDV